MTTTFYTATNIHHFFRNVDHFVQSHLAQNQQELEEDWVKSWYELFHTNELNHAKLGINYISFVVTGQRHSSIADIINSILDFIPHARTYFSITEINPTSGNAKVKQKQFPTFGDPINTSSDSGLLDASIPPFTQFDPSVPPFTQASIQTDNEDFAQKDNGETNEEDAKDPNLNPEVNSERAESVPGLKQDPPASPIRNKMTYAHSPLSATSSISSVKSANIANDMKTAKDDVAFIQDRIKRFKKEILPIQRFMDEVENFNKEPVQNVFELNKTHHLRFQSVCQSTIQLATTEIESISKKVQDDHILEMEVAKATKITELTSWMTAWIEEQQDNFAQQKQQYQQELQAWMKTEKEKFLVELSGIAFNATPKHSTNAFKREDEKSFKSDMQNKDENDSVQRQMFRDHPIKDFSARAAFTMSGSPTPNPPPKLGTTTQDHIRFLNPNIHQYWHRDQQYTLEDKDFLKNCPTLLKPRNLDDGLALYNQIHKAAINYGFMVTPIADVTIWDSSTTTRPTTCNLDYNEHPATAQAYSRMANALYTKLSNCDFRKVPLFQRAVMYQLSNNQDGFDVLYRILCLCHPRLVNRTAPMPKPVFNTNTNLFDYIISYQAFLAYEDILGRKYDEAQQLQEVLMCMTVDGRYERAVTNINISLEMYNRMKRLNPKEKFPDELLLGPLPFTIMNYYSNVEKEELFGTLPDDDNTDQKEVITINKMQALDLDSYGQVNVGYSKSSTITNPNGCKCCGGPNHDVFDSQSCKFAARMITVNKFLSENPAMTSKIVKTVNNAFNNNNKKQRGNRPGNLSRNFEAITKKNKVKFDAKIHKLVDYMDQALALDSNSEILDYSDLGLFENEDEDAFHDTTTDSADQY